MNDLEWFLDIGGKQSGPHAAKEIVDLVRSGRIPPSAQVTAARMSGDWVTAKDLVEAYDELYAKNVSKNLNDQFAPFTNSNPVKSDHSSQIPPRPTEQLEKSKIIYLNQEASERAPDPTDALFQAIQAVREKAQLKPSSPAPSSAPGAASRDSFGQVKRASGPMIPPQMILILTLAAIFGITVYGISILVGGKSAPTVDSKKTPARPGNDPALAPRPTSGTNHFGNNGLLDSGGAGTVDPRRGMSPGGVRPNSRTLPSSGGVAGHPASNDHLEKGGGARYRDERDTPVDTPIMDSQDVDEAESNTDGQEVEGTATAPVDPSQIESDGAGAPPSFPNGANAPFNPRPQQ